MICFLCLPLACPGVWLLFKEMVSWLLCFLCVTSSVSLTGSYVDFEPKSVGLWEKGDQRCSTISASGSGTKFGGKLFSSSLRWSGEEGRPLGNLVLANLRVVVPAMLLVFEHCRTPTTNSATLRKRMLKKK